MRWAFTGYERVDFSRIAWRDSEAEERGYMADHLLAMHELKGMHLSELFELLGEPDLGDLNGEWDTPLGFSPPLETIRDDYENLSEADFNYVGYRLGRRGARKGVPMAFPYVLSCYIDNGVVRKVAIED